jgi:two-component system OmpR family response regulator
MIEGSAARVLIVEDDDETARFEQIVLAKAGYEARIAANGSAGLQLMTKYHPDVVLLDIGLPDMSGLDVCTAIAESADAYILLVSGHAEEEFKLRGLGLGADDYITKPFLPSELVARIGAFLRRRDRARASANGASLGVGDARLLRDLQVLDRGDRAVALTALEFRLLWFLAEAEGRLLTRAQILERVWNDVSGVPTRVVDVHVAALRKKLSEVGSIVQISSVRGIGYRLDAA